MFFTSEKRNSYLWEHLTESSEQTNIFLCNKVFFFLSLSVEDEVQEHLEKAKSADVIDEVVRKNISKHSIKQINLYFTM